MTRRRRALLGTLALVGGVIATYATAWMAVDRFSLSLPNTSRQFVNEYGWAGDQWEWPWPIPVPLERPTSIDEYRAWGVRARDWGNTANLLYVRSQQAADQAWLNGLNPIIVGTGSSHMAPFRPRATIKEIRAGFPLHSVRWWRTHIVDEAGDVSIEERGGIDFRHSRAIRMLDYFDPSWRYPLRPVWPLFIANVLIWALALAGVVSGFAWMVHGRRVKRRRRRGWCLACGYNLSGLAPHQACPECGTPRAGAELSPPATMPGTIDEQGRRSPDTPPQSPLD